MDKKKSRLTSVYLVPRHKDLAEEVENGNFRQDLYYRINVIELNIPPLRERMSDLSILSEFMLTRISKQNQGST